MLPPTVKEAAGFLRIGSLNVKVRKTTEAFNNLLSRDVEARLHRAWGSSDSLPDAVSSSLGPKGECKIHHGKQRSGGRKRECHERARDGQGMSWGMGRRKDALGGVGRVGIKDAIGEWKRRKVKKCLWERERRGMPCRRASGFQSKERKCHCKVRWRTDCGKKRCGRNAMKERESKRQRIGNTL